jgi:hypothetical protein
MVRLPDLTDEEACCVRAALNTFEEKKQKLIVFCKADPKLKADVNMHMDASIFIRTLSKKIVDNSEMI